MYLTVEHAQNIEGAYKVDLSELIELPLCSGEETLQSLIVIKLATWALSLGASVSDVYPMSIFDDNGLELDAGPSDNPDWIEEVAKFAWYVEVGRDNWIDPDQIFAVVDGVGWKWFDFDDMEQSVTDEYRSEFDGDYEDYAIEWMSDTGESIPDHLESHFDFESYGQELVGELSEYKWNDRTFLYHS